MSVGRFEFEFSAVAEHVHQFFDDHLFVLLHVLANRIIRVCIRGSEDDLLVAHLHALRV